MSPSSGGTSATSPGVACLDTLSPAEREGQVFGGLPTYLRCLLQDELNHSQNCLFSPFAIKKAQKVMSSDVDL